mmetsp:Transcript_33448/g.51358  ORF Transcript_33448/g.51358 Transcript_33448/m.51358 type:complete len:188 (+) Transcript_33448:6852-7415(+)
MNNSESSKLESSLPFTLQTSHVRTSFDDRSSVPGESRNHGQAGIKKTKSNFIMGSVNESIKSSAPDTIQDSELPRLGSELGDLIVKEKIISESVDEDSLERRSGPETRKSSFKRKADKKSKGTNSFTSESICSTPREQSKVFRKSGASNWATSGRGAIGLNLVEDVTTSKKNIASALENKLYSMIRE